MPAPGPRPCGRHPPTAPRSAGVERFRCRLRRTGPRRTMVQGRRAGARRRPRPRPRPAPCDGPDTAHPTAWHRHTPGSTRPFGCQEKRSRPDRRTEDLRVPSYLVAGPVPFPRDRGAAAGRRARQHCRSPRHEIDVFTSKEKPLHARRRHALRSRRARCARRCPRGWVRERRGPGSLPCAPSGPGFVVPEPGGGRAAPTAGRGSGRRCGGPWAARERRARPAERGAPGRPSVPPAG